MAVNHDLVTAHPPGSRHELRVWPDLPLIGKAHVVELRSAGQRSPRSAFDAQMTCGVDTIARMACGSDEPRTAATGGALLPATDPKSVRRW
jgi:hypothetical protein